MIYVCVWTTTVDSASPFHVVHRSIGARAFAGPVIGSSQLSLLPGQRQTVPQAGCATFVSHAYVCCVRII